MVAMDFSGKSGGRVIQNPHEAQNAEQEEGQNWRVCMCMYMCSREINSLLKHAVNTCSSNVMFSHKLPRSVMHIISKSLDYC